MNSVLPVCRSKFSLLDGLASPADLVENAGNMGYEALLLADRNNLYGCYDFYYAAREIDLKPLIGVELTTEKGNLILIAADIDGFRNLTRLVTCYQLDQIPPVETIQRHRRGLVCLARFDTDLACLRDIFGDALYVIIDLNRPSRSFRMARRSGIKPVAAPPVRFLEKADWMRHRLLRAIDGGYLLDSLPPAEAGSPEDFLRAPGDYRRHFSLSGELPGIADELVGRCNLVFPARKNILPDIKIDGDHFEKLRRDSLSGLCRKISHPPGPYLARLQYELSVIRRTGFVDYFLIVGDLVNYCRSREIAVVGRGSAAGSLVSYSLGITQVDPVRESLYFERFLNEARLDCPDIDLDIDWRRRDDVLDFVYRKYGHDRVAMIASYVCFQPRLAVRETAKAMGLPVAEIERMLRRLPRYPPAGVGRPFAWPGISGGDRKRFLPVIENARSIYGLPRHLGIHAGGIVITPRPLTDYISLERAAKGIVVTQCDMYQSEKIGLVKIDILGQRGLAVIADCYRAARKMEGGRLKIPEADPATYRLLRGGKTIGVFQIESPGMRALLRQLKPRRLNDITLALALIRPGASDSGMKKIFLERFHGRMKTAYPHPRLAPVLDETHGVFIYQEQVILAAREAAGFNLAASDMIRRAITKSRQRRDYGPLAKRFRDGAAINGISEKTAGEIFAQMKQFAAFGFCKAHAATYGYIAYQSAYFKTHYPGIFMTAVLRNGGGYYPAAVYAAEARRLGIEIAPPDINNSRTHDCLKGNRLYLGMNRVRHITGEHIALIRRYRPFHSILDFARRTTLSQREIENLIKVGFFDSLEKSRPALLWQYRLRGSRATPAGSDLFGETNALPSMEKLPSLVPFSRYEIFRAESEILDLSASFHPLTLFTTHREIDQRRLAERPDGTPLAVTGWLADRKKIRTRNNQLMVFLTMDSLSDTFEVALFPDVYGRCRDVLSRYRYLKIEGTLSMEDGKPSIIGRKLSPAVTGLREMPHI